MLHFSIPSVNPFKLFSSEKPAIDISPVKVHDIDNAPEKSARALKHLLKLNHAKYAILYNDRKFHNHTPHVSLPTHKELNLSASNIGLILFSCLVPRSCKVPTRMI